MTDTKRVCAVCGKELARRAGGSRAEFAKRKFCSSECTGLFQRKHQASQCQHCDVEFYASASAKRKYCSPSCQYAARAETKTMKPCEVCGQRFHYQLGRSTRFCSHQCQGKSFTSRVERECDWCGERISIKRSKTGKDHNFCSRACSAKRQHQHRKEEGFYPAKLRVQCEKCGKKVEIHPCRVKEFRFCSRACAENGGFGPTRIEVETYAALDDLGVEYVPQHRIGRYWADAFVPSLNMVIEVQGDYWHCNPEVYTQGPINDLQEKAIKKDRRRTEYLKKIGYKVVYLWERDIRKHGAAALLRTALI